MKKLILHIGAGKCASSTLQRYLSHELTHDTDIKSPSPDGPQYAAFSVKEEILSGKQIQRIAQNDALQYVSSAPFPKQKEQLVNILQSLDKKFGKDDSVILSCEGWMKRIEPSVREAFEEFGVPLDIFLVTRPPVDWMNSAWWQWGVWLDITVEGWVRAKMLRVNFYHYYKAWASLNVTQTIKVVDISQDPVAAFQAFIGVQQKRVDNINVATHPELLRHLIANREKYGRTLHKSGIEFRLNQLLNLPQKSLPFVIPKPVCQSIIAEMQESNVKLIKLLNAHTPTLKPEVQRKYLDISAYSETRVEDLEALLKPLPNDDVIGHLINLLQEQAKHRIELPG